MSHPESGNLAASGGGLSGHRAQLDLIRQGFYPLEFEFNGASPQFEYARVNAQKGCDLAEVRGRAHTAMLSDNGAKQMDGRHIKVLWQLDGLAHLQQRARGSDIRADHWTVYDASAPYVMDMNDGSAFLALVLDTGNDPNWRRLVESVHGRPMPTDGTALVALSAARSVLHSNILLSERARHTLNDAIFSLLALPAFDDSPKSLKSSLCTVLADAKRYIMRNLASPDLDADEIAAALKMSRRTIYSAFSENGETPQSFILQTRLDHCHDALANGLSRSCPSITQLAFDYGFNDSAYFSRAFKRHFGFSPSHLLRVATPATGPARRGVALI